MERVNKGLRRTYDLIERCKAEKKRLYEQDDRLAKLMEGELSDEERKRVLSLDAELIEQIIKINNELTELAQIAIDLLKIKYQLLQEGEMVNG